MSDKKNISPLLDGFVVGSPMSSHGGIRCCPAIKENTDEKYIVKIISIPSSQVQLDALLLTGAYRTPSDAAEYFQEVAEEIVKEAELLNTVAQLDGFTPFEGWQIVPMEDGKLGYDVYLLSTYKRSLLKHMSRSPVTHLEAVNLGLDLCAALAICRRAGYLYVDLKPANVYLTREKQFRIGDLGFVKLDSLTYTSLPGKYRSPYSPPETQDDLTTLNETTDTYAVGMILYQIYNEGALPAAGSDPKEPFPCPGNADYEISAIIMKAIDPDPAKRWATPIVMGQALVRYMQRNTVNNVPIVPPSGIGLDADPVPVADPAEETSVEEVPAEAAAQTEAENVTASSEAPDSEEPEAPVLPEAENAQQTVEEAPVEEEPVEQEPEAEEPAEEVVDKTEDDDDLDDLDFSIAFEDHTIAEEEPEESPYPEPRPVPIKKQRLSTAQIRGRRIRNTILVLLVLAVLGFGSFWMYHNYYLQSIDVLTVDGTQSELIVSIGTKMDASLLEVSCTDTYGNTIVQGVSNGQAVFHDLLPDSLYRIEVTIKGLHRLTGPTSEIFTTDSLSNVVSMSAITGSEDGSVLLNFTMDGPEPEEWTVTCSADGEEPVVETFTGHTVTVKNLTVGKLYTFQLGTADGTQIIGDSSLEFTVTPLILAKNLSIVSCQDGIMSVRWDAPEGVTVDRWKVRCYSDDGHEEVLEIAGTEIGFTGIDNTKSYTVEVTASGMTESTRITLTANPISISKFEVDTSDPMRLTVDWAYEGIAPDGDWLMMYSLDNLPDQQNVVKSSESVAEIEPHIPGATYNISLQVSDSTFIFSNSYSFTTPEAGRFNQHDLSAEWITPYLLKTPEEESWTAETVGKDVYTDTFRTGDSISVVLKAADAFLLPKDVTPVLYVIRDAEGNVLSRYVSEENVIWEDLWYPDDYHNCELTIPKVPTEPGSYSLSIYFNYRHVANADFTITE